MNEEVKRLCFRCVGESYLRDEIKRTGEKAPCSYCGASKRGLPIPEIADFFELVFEQHFYKTPEGPSSLEWTLQKETDYDWERPGEPVLHVMQEIADIDEAVAVDIRELLNERHDNYDPDDLGVECEFHPDSYYSEKRVNSIEWQSMWREFEERLKSESRFFSKSAAATLAAVFSDLEEYRTHSGHKIIVTAGPNHKLGALFRARVFQADDKLERALARPDIEIGSPPALVAAAGRMNARGISVFYGATDPKVAIAEVRPFVGSRVVSGRFEIIRELRLLDLEAFRGLRVPGSLFDPGFLSRLEKEKFLNELSHLITAPVMPDDEAFSYLPTQAIADFLATELTPSLDGIIYPSAQGSKGKKNVVLFHKAALVEPLKIPEGTEITAQLSSSTSDGDEIDYWVWESTPKEGLAEKGDPAWASMTHRLANQEERTPALRLITASMKVHHIAAIALKMDDYPVKRHRSVKRDDFPF